MAIAYQNKSEVKVGINELSITIPVPSGFSAGDLLIACIAKDGVQGMNTPTGWTLIQKGSYLGVFYRIAEVGDTEWTWSCAVEETWYGVILRYTGQASSGFIHASDMSIDTSNTPTAPDVSYTDLETGSLCLQMFGCDGDDTPFTTPVQLTERYNDVSNVGAASCGGAGGDKVISGTGDTGTAIFTINVSSTWRAVTVVIEAEYRPPVTHEIAGVINGVASVNGDIGIATLPQYAHILHRWKLDEESGTRYDFIGNCDLADNNTVLYGTGKIDNAADFEADTSEYLSATAETSADMDFTNSNFSISFWLKLENDTTVQFFLKKGIGAQSGYSIFFDSTPNKIMWRVNQSETAQNVWSNDNIASAGTWVHITIVRDGNTGYIYKNGVDDTSASDTLINPVSSSQPLNIGRRATATPYHTDGLLDEVIVWNVALSPAEVSTLYNWYNKLHGTINAVSQIEGLLKTDKYIKAIVNGISTIAGDLKGTFFIAGSIDAISQVIGKIAGDVSVSGQIQALSELSGQIIVAKFISGSIDAVSQLEGNLTGIFYLVGEVQGISAITGLPHIIRFLKGTIEGQSVIIGILEDADKWSKPDRDTSQFSKTSRGASTFTKTSRDASTFVKEDR